MTKSDPFSRPGDADRAEMIRAALGELSGDALRIHEQRLSSDLAYRAAFQRLVRTSTMLRTLPPPRAASLAAGFDARVLARLRDADGSDALALAMDRQFRRLAPAALAAAVLMIALTLGVGSSAAAAEVTLSSWYPLSSDPTVLP